MTPEEARAERLADAATFEQDEVVACYGARPPYAPALLEFLPTLATGRTRALDIGCGPGKITGALADHFAEVVALDPSPPMIEAGKSADAGRHDNIVWVEGRAEAYETAAAFDLVTAGSSIHWTDPAAVFPKLARWTGLLALLNDNPTFPAPAPPCGHDAWVDFLTLWLERTGRQAPPAWRTPNPDAWSLLGDHGAWIDIIGRRRFAYTHRQSVEDFVISCHSRPSWNRRRMGAEAVAGFDAALDEMMRPFATDGVLELDVVSELTWGVPRRTPLPGSTSD